MESMKQQEFRGWLKASWVVGCEYVRQFRKVHPVQVSRQGCCRAFVDLQNMTSHEPSTQAHPRGCASDSHNVLCKGCCGARDLG